MLDPDVNYDAYLSLAVGWEGLRPQPLSEKKRERHTHRTQQEDSGAREGERRGWGRERKKSATERELGYWNYLNVGRGPSLLDRRMAMGRCTPI